MPINSFEDWVVDRFGRRLFEKFFKGYTEKVWGIPCSEISADWAAQRIKGLSLASAVRNAVFKDRAGQIKTLVDEFVYPRLGAGQAYEMMAAAIEGLKGEVKTGAPISRLRREGNRVVSATVDSAAGAYDVEGRYFLISAPLTDLVEMIEPEAPEAVRAAARALALSRAYRRQSPDRGPPVSRTTGFMCIAAQSISRASPITEIFRLPWLPTG